MTTLIRGARISSRRSPGAGGDNNGSIAGGDTVGAGSAESAGRADGVGAGGAACAGRAGGGASCFA